MAKRSTIRVCQPGPVARHSAMTSGGKRKLINWRGFATRGRPPLLTTALVSISSVSSGNSLYSCGLIGCASTRAKSEPEVRREAILFTFIGLSHAEYVANCPTRRVPDDNHPAFQQAKADDPKFAVVLALVFHLNCCSLEDDQGVFKVQAAFSESLLSLGLVVGQTHQDIVYTKTCDGKQNISREWKRGTGGESKLPPATLLNGHTLGQIPRLVHIRTPRASRVVRQ